jgi:hypothetical protein
MKNVIAISAFLAATTLAVSASAQNEDFANQAGTLGIGINRSIADGEGISGPIYSQTGLSIRYFATEDLGLELIVGGSINSQSAEAGGVKGGASSSQWDISILADYRIATSRQATLNGYGGFGISLVGSGVTGEAPEPADGTVEGYTDIAIELGLRGEVFLTRHFSIFSRVGITIDPVSDTEIEFGNVEDNDLDNSGMNLAIMRGGLLGSMGMTFWF